MNVTIIGFGEAGPVFGKALLAAEMSVTAYDRLQADPASRDQQINKTVTFGVTPAASADVAVESADLIISTVTASDAVEAAVQAKTGLRSGSIWLDLNSVSPDTKKSVCDQVMPMGVQFVEGVAMDTVPSKGAQVPILLCGTAATELSIKLNEAGLNTRCVGTELGIASSTKLLRSVIIKGMEALFAESMEAAGKMGVEKDVLDSLCATYPELDWSSVAAYQLSRATLHAGRRAAEMRESAALIEKLGISPVMAAATAAKHQELADRGIAAQYRSSNEPEVADFITATQA